MKYTKTTNILLFAHLRQLLTYLLLLFLIPGTAMSDALRFSTLAKSDGLNQGTVTALVQDDYGFIWIGTEDGLARYDGSRLHSYRNDPDNPDSVQDNVIKGLAKDASGRVWVASEADGVSYYDYESARFVKVASDIIGTGIETIFSSNLSTQVFIHSDKGVFSIDTDDDHVTKTVRLLAPEQAGAVISVHEDERFIQVTLGSGEQLSLSMADGAIHKRVLVDAQISQAWSLDSCQTLFLASTSNPPQQLELYCNNGLQTSVSPISTLLSDAGLELSSIGISDVHELTDGTVWIASAVGLINIKDNHLSVSKHLPYDELSLSSSDLTKLYVGQNTLFIGTQYDGLNMLNTADTPFTYLDLLNSSTDVSGPASFATANTSCGPSSRADYDTVWSILPASNGDLWVGNNNGLAIQRSGTDDFADISRVGNEGNTMHLCSVWSLAETDDHIWIGIWGGLISVTKTGGDMVHYLPQADSKTDASKQLSGKFVRLLLHDKTRHSLWIGTNKNGLNRLDLATNEITHYPFSATDKTQLPHGRVRSLYLGPDHRLWVGTGGGLSVWDEASNTFTTLPASSTSTDLSDEDVRAINHYKDDYYWIGTGNGINLFNASTFSVEARLNEKDGLANSTVYAMVPDNTGHYWITTANGLSRFNPRTRTFANYTYHHGLQSNEFNFNAWAVGDDGNIFIGGLNGLNLIDVDKPLAVKQNFGPVLTRITGTDSDSHNLTISRFPVRDEKQIIPSQFRNITFDYAFPAFSGGNQQMSQHRLTASSMSWSDAYPGSNTAVYTNVKHGNHYFQMKTSSQGEFAAQYQVYVTPSVWQTLWFRLLMMFMAVAALLTLFLAYNRRRVNSSLEALTRQHYYILEHELSPHLYQANANLDTFSKSPSIDQNDREYIDKSIRPLLDRSIRFLGGVKELVEFETAVTQPKNLYMLEDIVDEVLLVFDTNQQQIHVAPFDDVNIRTHQDAVYLLLSNLLSNAIKYSDPDSKVVVKITTHKTNLIIECIDSGVGIRADRLQEIYKPYTRLQTTDNSQSSGLGLGLSIVKFIVHTYNGSIVVEGNPPQGSRFIVTLTGVVTGAA